jgi:hypothetical protein
MNLGALKLPLFILQIKGLKVDSARQADLFVDIYYQADTQFSKLDPKHLLYKPYNLSKRRGQPISIEYELTLVSRFKEDLDQMMTNWMVNYRPDIYVRWWHPRNKSFPLESEIVWNRQYKFR